MRKGQVHEPISKGSSSCAACKLLKRRCNKDSCIFAPYFRADEPKKFAKVHKVFGASNVSKILQEVPQEHRHDAVLSLSYEAEARLLDPVYGCLGPIAFLQHRMAQLQRDLALTRARLAAIRHYHVPNLSPPLHQQQQPSNVDPAHNQVVLFDGVQMQTALPLIFSNDDRVAIMRDEVIDQYYDKPMWQNDHSNSELVMSQSSSGCYNNNSDFGQVPLLPL